MWRILGLFLLATVSVGTETVAQEAETDGKTVVEFTFAPPDSTTYTQWIEATREKQFEGLGSQTDWSKSETTVSYERVPEGFLMEARSVSTEMTRDGQPITDPIAKLLEGVVVRYSIGLDGQIESIEGFAGILERATETMPPELAETLGAVLGEEALIAREVAEWNGRVGDFAGATLEIGESFESDVPFTLPDGGEIVYHTRTWLAGFEPCAVGDCVRVEHRYDSDADALNSFVSEMTTAIGGSRPPEPSISTSGARILGGASRLIDPATMLIYEETADRTMAMEIEVPGVGRVPTVLHEQRKYSFDFTP